MTTNDRRVWAVLVVAALVIGWIVVRTQITADRQERESHQAVAFAADTQQCLTHLVEALRVRAAITDTADRFNNDQHRVLREMIAAVAAAPVERKGDVLDQYLPQVVEAQQRQEALLQDRAQHPLPDPSCPR